MAPKVRQSATTGDKTGVSECDKLSTVDKMSQVRDVGQLAQFIIEQTAKSRAEVFDALPAIVKECPPPACPPAPH